MMKKILILLLVFLGGIAAQSYFAARDIEKSAAGFRNYMAVFRLRPDKRYFTKHAPNVPFPLFNTNAEGFRDTESFQKKLSENCSTPVIVLMGGSGVFGSWLKYPQTMGPALQEEMKLAGMPVRVFNLGQLGYSVIQGKRLAEDWFPVLRPDIVIFNYGHYETMPATTGQTMREMLEGPVPDNFTLFGRKIHSSFLNLLSIKGFNHPNATMEDFRDSLLKIASKGKEYGAETFLLPLVLSDEYSNSKFNFNESMLDELKSISKTSYPEESGIFYAEKLKNMTDKKYFVPDGAHYSAEGIRLLAKILVPDLMQKLSNKTLNQTCTRVKN